MVLKGLFKVGGMLMEKTIKDFVNYTISDNGIVRNKKTNTVKKGTSNNTGNGYLYVDLYRNNKKTRKYIHRLVAESFIPNNDNKPMVNHKDGDTKNNQVSNLEWVTAKENVEHASKVLNRLSAYKIATNNKKKKIKQIDMITGKIIKIFNSISEASRETGIPLSNIVCVLKGRQNRTKDYKWCYCEELEEV